MADAKSNTAESHPLKARSQSIALLRNGFRPFFLGAGLWAIAAMVVRLGDLAGLELTGAAFGDPNKWHAHAFLYGYAGAVIAGFLLTAIPNWTGRSPIASRPLAALALLWLGGRVALLVPGIPFVIAACVDAAFLIVFAGYIARELVAGRNMRNAPVGAVVALLALSNVIFHLEASAVLPDAGYGTRLPVALITVLIGVIGGRVVPSFTSNWFAQQREPRIAPASRHVEIAVHCMSALALLAWVSAPLWRVSGVALLIAGVLHAIRLMQWRGWRTSAEPLVTILHIAYAWVAIGLCLLGGAILFEAALVTSGLHALTAGAIGTMTLAMMTRATLGHTGRPLTASRGTLVLYAAVTVGALCRVGAGFAPDFYLELLMIAGAAWMTAFALFVVIYGPLFLRQPRLSE